MYMEQLYQADEEKAGMKYDSKSSFTGLKNESTIGKNERNLRIGFCSIRVSLAHEYVYFEAFK